MLHITVGVTSGGSRGGITIGNDLQMIKAAMLYGDSVRVCSLTSTMLTSMLLIAEIGTAASNKQKAEFFEQIFEGSMSYLMGSEDQAAQARLLIDQYKSLLNKKRLRREELLLRERLKSIFNRMWRNMRDVIHDMAEKAQYGELLDALESGIVQLHLFEEETDGEKYLDDLTQNFLTFINKAVTGQETYPLLDDLAGSLIRTQIQEGKLNVSESNIARSRHLGLAADLFERLPLFDLASVLEVLDIRSSLEKPLIRFRSAVLKYSEHITPAQWDKDFPLEAEQMFLKEVLPTVLEIEESIQSNTYLKSLISRYVNKPQVLSGPALAVAMSQFSTLPEIVSISFGFGTAGLTAADVYNEWKQTKKGIEQNQLFFYYKLRKTLEKA